MKCWRRIEAHSASEKKLLWLSVISATLVLLADIFTKIYFTTWNLGESRDVIPGIISFTYVRNLGAAWSILSGYRGVLTVFGLVVAVIIGMFFRKFAENCPERYPALLLVVSGIIGNSADRIFRGAVVDFIHVHYYDSWHYPIFNIADIAICCGIAVFVLSGFFRKDLKKENENCNS